MRNWPAISKPTLSTFEWYQSNDNQLIINWPAPVDVEVDLVVLAVHAGVHPGAVLVVPTQHPVLLPPSVVIIPAPASSVMPTSKPSRRLPELVANIGPGTDHGSLLQSLPLAGFPSRAWPGVLVLFLTTGSKPSTGGGGFPSFWRSINLNREELQLITNNYTAYLDQYNTEGEEQDWQQLHLELRTAWLTLPLLGEGESINSVKISWTTNQRHYTGVVGPPSGNRISSIESHSRTASMFTYVESLPHTVYNIHSIWDQLYYDLLH